MPKWPNRQAVPSPEITAAGDHGGQVRAGDELWLGVAAMARRLGVAPATLRTWDRRYGLGPAEHAPGAHRRYSAADVARLEAMHHALVQGAAPAEAARYALAARPQPTPAPPASSPPPDRPQLPDPPLRPVRVAGRSLRLPGAGARARGLARAAVSLDAAAVRELLDDSLAADGVIDTWDLVVRPVLTAIGNCWSDTGAGVEIEHLLTDGTLGALRALRYGAAVPGSPRPVLLACVPDELHSLPLYPLSAQLAARGIRCRVLGAALPADALLAAVRRTAPSVVFLWAQLTRYAAPDLLGGLPRLRPRVRVFAGGPGWAGTSLPLSVELLHSLAAATDRISAAGGTNSRRRVTNFPPSTIGH
jgi:DNA-binding transcriptional MerR regulator